MSPRISFDLFKINLFNLIMRIIFDKIDLDL